jgi:hypothetical protein
MGVLGVGDFQRGGAEEKEEDAKDREKFKA